MKRCPYCGQKITVDAAECKHCGKQVRKNQESDSAGMSSLKTYEEKRVPAWVMYLVVALAIFCCVLMGLKGCEKGRGPDSADTSTEQPQSEQPLSEPAQTKSAQSETAQ